MSFYFPHTSFTTATTSRNLLKLFNYKPKNTSEALKVWDAFARHPSVHYHYAGAFASAAFFTCILGRLSPESFKESQAVHRQFHRENYKRLHGHYPH